MTDAPSTSPNFGPKPTPSATDVEADAGAPSSGPRGGDAARNAHAAARRQAVQSEGDLVDEAGAESFPASDPPAWTPGGAGTAEQ